VNRFGVVTLLVLAAASSVRAEPTIVLPTITGVLPGTSGQSFDVTVSNPTQTAAGSGEAVGSYTLSFVITPRAGATGTISLTGDWAVAPPTNPLMTTNPAQGLSASKFFVSDFVATDPVTLDHNKRVFRGLFSTSANANGTFDLTFFRSSGDPLTSEFQDGLNATVPTTLVNGSITVPEPGALTAIAASAGLILVRRRRRA